MVEVSYAIASYMRSVQGSIFASGFGPPGFKSASKFGPGGSNPLANLDRRSKSPRTPGDERQTMMAILNAVVE